ncbi:flagellar protein FlaG [Pontibacterium sp.]|uniref:flagellar protein FlaG n=1 Tax=Pontibacterium sp. TaxID=2036026 RepID=UPI0035149CC1
MAIESMGGATSIAPSQQTQHAQQSQQAQQTQQPVQSPAETPKNERIQQQVKETQELSVEKLEAAIDRINEMMRDNQRSLNFSVDKGSEEVVVQVRDSETDQVVRQIPNEEALKFAESLDRMMGLIFDEEA